MFKFDKKNSFRSGVLYFIMTCIKNPKLCIFYFLC